MFKVIELYSQIKSLLFSSRLQISIVVPYGIASYFFSDPRTAKWLLMSSPGPLLTILATYWYFCISAGPRYMKDRKPYNLKTVIQIYNAVQVLLSVYLVWEVSFCALQPLVVPLIRNFPKDQFSNNRINR